MPDVSPSQKFWNISHEAQLNQEIENTNATGYSYPEEQDFDFHVYRFLDPPNPPTFVCSCIRNFSQKLVIGSFQNFIIDPMFLLVEMTEESVFWTSLENRMSRMNLVYLNSLFYLGTEMSVLDCPPILIVYNCLMNLDGFISMSGIFVTHCCCIHETILMSSTSGDWSTMRQ